MKRTLYAAAFLAAIVMLQACGQEETSTLKTTPPAVKLYGIEKARIEYTYSGAASGTKTSTFANWGMYQRMDDKFTFTAGPETRTIHSIDITNDSTVYAVDVVEKKGTKSVFDFAGFEVFTADFSAEEKENFQASYILRNGGTKVGTEMVLDRECDVYELAYMAMKISLWEGITLKSSMTMGADTMTLTATSIDTEYTATIDEFLPPADVQVTDLTQGLPPGHPPMGGEQEMGGGDMPAGHPDVAPMSRSDEAGGEMPEGHPPMGGSGE